MPKFKNTDQFRIMGTYKDGEAEEIDTATDKKEAKKYVKEYRLAFGEEWNIWFEKNKR